MSLKDRIKAIFKKHGFTLIVVVSAVTVINSVLASILKRGLSTLGGRLGNGFKDVGKKFSQISQGLVGAIASFIFRAARGAIGFLGKMLGYY